MEVKETMLFGNRNPYLTAFRYLELMLREYKIPVQRILAVRRTYKTTGWEYNETLALIKYTEGSEQRIRITGNEPLLVAEKVLHVIIETRWNTELHI